MGGTGSSRWQGHPKRPIVEHSLSIDSLALSRAGALDRSGTIVRWEQRGKPISSVAVGALKLPDGRRELLVAYKARGESAHTVAEAFTLERVPMGVVGARWFFRCPDCDGRARKLFMPPGAQHFRCLKCSEATYFSAQTHDDRVYRLRRGDPETMRWAFTRVRRLGTYGSLAWAKLVIDAVLGTPNRPGLSSARVTFDTSVGDAGGAEGAPTREAARG